MRNEGSKGEFPFHLLLVLAFFIGTAWWVFSTILL
jgi:hypothetical protein